MVNILIRLIVIFCFTFIPYFIGWLINPSAGYIMTYLAGLAIISFVILVIGIAYQIVGLFR